MHDGRFDHFVILAGMRTGSNLLERSLNTVAGIRCYGEVFNPAFVGHQGKTELLGISLPERAQAPLTLLERLKEEKGVLPGFRFFRDHDRRVLDHVLADPKAAKILLWRDPVDSYVSWKLARATGQWILTGDASTQGDPKIRFVPGEFEEWSEHQSQFEADIRHTLRLGGQGWFSLSYEDVQDPEVVAGLAAYLGVPDRPDLGKVQLRKQNTRPLEEVVVNLDEMRAHLATQEPHRALPTISGTPERRPPGARTFVFSERGLAFLPLRGPYDDAIVQWMAALDGVAVEQVTTGLSQPQVRVWRRDHPDALCFSVLAHPVARALSGFAREILPGGDRYRAELWAHLGLPGVSGPPSDQDKQGLTDALLAYLKLIRRSLQGHTGLPVPGHWAPQSDLLHGMSRLTVPDRLLRADELEAELGRLAQGLCPGAAAQALKDWARPAAPIRADLYTADVEAAVRATYKRDYDAFGFADWRPPGAPG